MTAAAALEAIDRILSRDDDADNVLRDVVAALVDTGACDWAGILFAEEGEPVPGPEAGTQTPTSVSRFPSSSTMRASPTWLSTPRSTALSPSASQR